MPHRLCWRLLCCFSPTCAVIKCICSCCWLRCYSIYSPAMSRPQRKQASLPAHIDAAGFFLLIHRTERHCRHVYCGNGGFLVASHLEGPDRSLKGDTATPAAAAATFTPTATFILKCSGISAATCALLGLCRCTVSIATCMRARTGTSRSCNLL